MLGVRPKKIERRRPLPGDNSQPKVVQYYRSAPRPAGQEGRQQRPREKRVSDNVVDHLKRLPIYLSIFVIGVSVMYCSILGNTVSVVLPDTTLYSKEFYTSQVGAVLNSSVFNHSKLTLNIRAFKAAIQAKLPEVSDVTVSIPLIGRKPIVGLSIIPAQYLLSLPDASSYIVGATGVVLANARGLASSSYSNLQVLQEDVPLKVNVGKAIMTETDINFIQTVAANLHSAGQTVSSLELPVGASELFVHLKGESYVIKFALNRDARQQVGAYLAVKNKLGGNVPMSYVDVRIGERVYVK